MKKIIDFELLRCEPSKAHEIQESWVAEIRFPNSPLHPPSQIFGTGGMDKYDALWNLAQFVNDIYIWG